MGSVEVSYRARTLALTDAERSAGLRMLSSAERDRWATEARADSFLAGRILLRELIPGDFAVVARCPDCGEEHGRPRVPGLPVSVSLSRSTRLVVAAMSTEGDIGVDVEDEDQPASRLDAIESLTGVRSLERWTQVEAVLKADGRGLRVDPRDVHVTGMTASISGGSAQFRLSPVDIPGLVGTIAVREETKA